MAFGGSSCRKKTATCRVKPLIAVYFYTRERPPEETAPAHSSGLTAADDIALHPTRAHPERGRLFQPANPVHCAESAEPDQVSLYTKSARESVPTVRNGAELDAFGCLKLQENARIKEQSDKQKEQIGTYKKILGEVEVSPSFRIGRLLTWPLRVLRGFGRGS